MNRESGVLMHISSLFGNYSSGSFGEEARYFIDFLSDCNFTYWQVLPFGITDDHNSPYMSFSSIGGNMFFIDLDQLYQESLITKDELDKAKQTTPYLCEFERLTKERFKLLKKASQRIKDKSKGIKYKRMNKYLKDNFKTTIEDVIQLLSKKGFKFGKVKSLYSISVNYNIIESNSQLKLDTLIRLIDYGNVDIKGINLINSAVEYACDNVLNIYRAYKIKGGQ